MNGRMLRGALALGITFAVSACGGSSEPEPINPIPGTLIQLTTEDGLNHGPVTSVALEAADPAITQLTVPVAETINVKAMGYFADGYSTDVSEHAYFQATSGVALGSLSDDGVPLTGATEGTSELTLILGTLDQPTAQVTVTPALLKSVSIQANAATVTHRSQAILVLVGTYGDGSQAPLTDATWSSSDDAIATITEAGVVSRAGDGTVTITGSYDGLSDTYEIATECNYPDGPELFRFQQTAPNISWKNAVFPSGVERSVSLRDVYCGNNGLGGYNAIMMQVSAEWCQPCRIMRSRFNEDRAAFDAHGVLPIFNEIETRSREQIVTSEMANRSMSAELDDDFGIRVGDFDAIPENALFRQYRSAVERWSAFPTFVVIRTSDMQVVATSRTQYSEFLNNYEQIFENPDLDWTDILDPKPR